MKWSKSQIILIVMFNPEKHFRFSKTGLKMQTREAAGMWQTYTLINGGFFLPTFLSDYDSVSWVEIE